ncbi:MAG: DUF2493 domain-containing protein [Candidatus Obscuribacterales bacterium]|nr:DUF2493 domain-containing protein [Candidatus Obscuribacterales bacterium]
MSVVIVCGGRHFGDKAAVYGALDAVHALYPIRLVIEGGASGADSYGKQWACDRKVEFHTENADWDLHGKRAGHIRNGVMLNIQRAVSVDKRRQALLAGTNPEDDRFVVAFPGDKGTANMVGQAKRAGVKVIEIGHWMPSKLYPEAYPL